jgi:hypothetical protein
MLSFRLSQLNEKYSKFLFFLLALGMSVVWFLTTIFALGARTGTQEGDWAWFFSGVHAIYWVLCYWGFSRRKTLSFHSGWGFIAAVLVVLANWFFLSGAIWYEKPFLTSANLLFLLILSFIGMLISYR